MTYSGTTNDRIISRAEFDARATMETLAENARLLAILLTACGQVIDVTYDQTQSPVWRLREVRRILGVALNGQKRLIDE